MGHSCPSPPYNALATQTRKCPVFPPFRRDRLEEGPQIINAAGRGGSRSCEAPLAPFRVVGRGGGRVTTGRETVVERRPDVYLLVLHPSRRWIFLPRPSPTTSATCQPAHLGSSRRGRLVRAAQSGTPGERGVDLSGSLGRRAGSVHQGGQGRGAWRMCKGRRGAYVSLLPREELPRAELDLCDWSDTEGVGGSSPCLLYLFFLPVMPR